MQICSNNGLQWECSTDGLQWETNNDNLNDMGEYYIVLWFLAPALQHDEIGWKTKQKHTTTFCAPSKWISQAGGGGINTAAANIVNIPQVVF